MKGSTCSIKSTNKPEQHSCEYRRIQTQQAPQATLTSLKRSQRQNSFVWSAIFCPKSKRDTPTFCTMRLGFFICLRQPAEMRRLLHFLQRSAWKPKRVRQGKSLGRVGREPPPFWSHSDPTKNVWLRNDDNDVLCVAGLREQRSNFCCSGVTVAVRPGGSPHVKCETFWAKGPKQQREPSKQRSHWFLTKHPDLTINVLRAEELLSGKGPRLNTPISDVFLQRFHSDMWQQSTEIYTANLDMTEPSVLMWPTQAQAVPSATIEAKEPDVCRKTLKRSKAKTSATRRRWVPSPKEIFRALASSGPSEATRPITPQRQGVGFKNRAASLQYRAVLKADGSFKVFSTTFQLDQLGHWNLELGSQAWWMTTCVNGCRSML